MTTAELNFKAWLDDAAKGRRYLTREQIIAIRDSIKPQDGWDGDDWDIALAEAIERAVLAGRAE